MIKPGIKIDDSELKTVLTGIINRCENKGQGLKTIGAIARESIRTNFHQGGRPKKWAPSKRASADGVPGRSGAVLRDTNRLMNSITSTVTGDRVIVGTNVVYAAVHNYGAKKFSFGTVVARVAEHQRLHKSGKYFTVKAHTRKMQLPWGDIPARPFMVLQPQDIKEIEAEMANFISGEGHAKNKR